MILSIGGFHSGNDPEYQRIARELRANGISPSGDKAVDKMKLKRIKSEIIEKIKSKANKKAEIYQQEEKISNNMIQHSNPENTNISGAMALAELNRIYHNI